MKVLLVSSSSSNSGGGELYFLKIGASFVAMGHCVSVVYSASNAFDEISGKAALAGLHVIRIPYTRIYDLPLRSLGLFLGHGRVDIDAALVDAPDVIHISQQNVEDGINLVAALGDLCPTKVVITIHTSQSLSSLGQQLGPLRQLYSARVYKRLRDTAAFAFVAHAGLDAFQQMFGFAPKRSHIVYNGAVAPSADPTRRRAVLARYGIAADAWIIGSVGRLEAPKNYSLLIKAFAKFVAGNPHGHLLLVGDGSERTSLIDLASRMGVKGQITITGWVDNPEDYYCCFDTFVLPSLFEGFPFVLVEALLAGCRCLASDIKAHRECLEGEQRFLFNSGSEDSLVTRLVEAYSPDPHLDEARARLRCNAAYRFSEERMLSSILELYSQAASARA